MSRKHPLFKIVSVILVITFITLDISWAYPLESLREHKLAAQGVFQQQMLTEQAQRLQESIFSDVRLLTSVFSVAQYLLGDPEEKLKPLPLEYLESVMRNELGEALAGVELSKVVPREGVILIPYTKGKEKCIIQVALKDDLSARELAGYEWVVSDRYVIKVLPEGYKEPAVTFTESEEEPRIEISEPIAEIATDKIEISKDAGVSKKPFTFSIKAIITSILIVVAFPLTLFAGTGQDIVAASGVGESSLALLSGLKNFIFEHPVITTFAVIIIIVFREPLSELFLAIVRHVIWRVFFPVKWHIWRAQKLSDAVRNDASKELVKIGKPAVKALIKMLESKYPSRRITAAEILIKIGDPRAIGPLIERFSDPSDGVRTIAAKVSEINATKAQTIDGCIRALSKGDHDVCEFAGRKLIELGDAGAIGPLFEELKRASRKNADIIYMTLKELGAAPEQLSAVLCESVRNPNVLRILRKLRDERAVKPLVEALESPDIDPELRKDIIVTLDVFPSKVLADEKAIEPLIESLQDSDFYVCLAAINALEKHGSDRAIDFLSNYRAIDALIEKSQDKNNSIRSAATRALGSFGRGSYDGRIIESLIGRLKDWDSKVCREAVEAVHSFSIHWGDRRAVMPLFSALENPAFSDWSHVIIALDDLAPSLEQSLEGWCKVLKALGGENHEKLKTVVIKLLKLRDARAVEPLIAKSRSYLHPDLHKDVEKTLKILGATREQMIEYYTTILQSGPLISSPFSFIGKAAAKALGEMGDVKSLPVLFAGMKIADEGFRPAIIEAIYLIIYKNEKVLEEDEWKAIIELNSMETLLYVFKTFSVLYNREVPWLNIIRRFTVRLQKEIDNYSQEEQALFRKQICQNIDRYIDFVAGPGKRDAARLVAEYGDIRSLLSVVHDNLPLCLDSIRNIGKRVSDFEILRKTLPLNNALTRIIRMFGEPEDMVDGYRDVTEKIIASGGFDKFYEIVVSAAERRKRSSPQEVSGMFEILRSYSNLRKWNRDDWNEFAEQIKQYYSHGFKVITYQLFSYFKEHRDDEVTLGVLKKDINEQMGNIAWGGFNGLSKRFMKRYGLSGVDELALLAKYMPISNLSARDYSGKCEQIKQAITGRTGWKDEVDESLRKLYRLGGMRTAIVYAGPNQLDRDVFNEKLKGYIDKSVSLESAVSEFISTQEARSDEVLKKAAISFAIENGQQDAEYLRNIPADDAGLRQWLSRWHALLADVWKKDCPEEVRRSIRELIRGKSSAELQDIFKRYKIPSVSIKEKKELFRMDNDIVMVMLDKSLDNAQRIQNLADIYERKWFNRIDDEEAGNNKLIAEWIERGIDKYVRKLDREIKKRTEESTFNQTELKDVIREAVLLASKKATRTSSDKRTVLSDRITQQFLRVFDQDIINIEKELKLYKTVQRKTAGGYYVGFFDDLLHLMGFMMTGVCTWGERDRQVKDKRYHFGKIALKNPSGKILGLSQVQLLKAGIQGLSRSQSPKGWRVIALPGINLYQGDIGLDKEKAMLAILEAAQRLARESGMEGAVIPVSGGIHSNHPFEKSFINELHKKGWLKKKQLSGKVTLTSGYNYQEVYLVDIPLDQMTLAETSLTERVEEEQLQSQKMEKEESMDFGNGLGEIVYDKGAHKTAIPIREECKRLLSGMPQGTIDDLRLKAQIDEIDLRVRIDPQAGESLINKTDREIELTLGKDILYKEGKIETVTFAEMFSELLAALLLSDYDKLKQESNINENAYFKLQIIKSLINYRNYLASYHKIIQKYSWDETNYLSEKSPQQVQELFTKYEQDLEKFTKGIDKISQWNIFLNEMDDADPDFVLVNYIYILLGKHLTTDDDIAQIIREISRVDVFTRLSLAILRNAFKDFILPGKVRLKTGDEVQAKGTFTHFDHTGRLLELKDRILTTKNRGEFYTAVKDLIAYTLPLSEEQLNSEMTGLVDKDIFAAQDREEILRQALEEILVRRIGRNAFTSIREHLTGQRSFKAIPYVKISQQDLPEGADADENGFQEFIQTEGVDYTMVFSGEESEGEDITAPKTHDWIEELFRMAPQDRGSSSTTLFSFNPFAVMLAAAGLDSVLSGYKDFWLAYPMNMISAAVIVGGIGAVIFYAIWRVCSMISGAPVNIERPAAVPIQGKVESKPEPELKPEERPKISEPQASETSIAADQTPSLFELVESTINNNRTRIVNAGNKLAAFLSEQELPEETASLCLSGIDREGTTAEVKGRLEQVLTAMNRLEIDLPENIKSIMSETEKNFNRLETDSIIATLITLAMRAGRENQKLIIGLETDWIPGYEKGKLQHNAMNPLIREIESLGDTLRDIGLDNVILVHSSSETLADDLLKEADRTSTALKNVVVLASNDVIGSDKFTSLRSTQDEERAFLAGVDPAELEEFYKQNEESFDQQLHIKIMDMLSIALELAMGKDAPDLPMIARYDKALRIVVFLPKAKALDYDELREFHNMKKLALKSA